MPANPDFTRFWVADTVSGFGSYVTTVALQVLVVVTLGGTAVDVGLLNGARWLPYLVLGLVAGAWVDRVRRRPLLVGCDLGRGALLLVIPLLWAVGALRLPALLALMVAFGVLNLLGDAAAQSYLPRLVPRSHLLMANARLDQSSSVAQTSGPVIGGALVSLVGAPLAVLVDALSYLVSGLTIAWIGTVEPVSSVVAQPARRHLLREAREGLRFAYRHPELGPNAIDTHAWFLVNSVATTVFVPFVLLGLGFSALELGVALAAAGVGGLLGALRAVAVGQRFGAGPTVIGARAVYPLAWLVIALVPTTWAHGHGAWALGAVVVGQLLYGLALGVENASEMGFRQAITPDGLQGRVNASIRSVNRAMIVVGAPVGGLAAEQLGYRPVLLAVVVGYALVALALAATPFRRVGSLAG